MDYEISADRLRLDMDVIHGYLTRMMEILRPGVYRLDTNGE